MHDLALNKFGDLDINAIGDVTLTESIRQAVLVRLRWIQEEWRLGPELGLPYFSDVLVKNPNLDSIGLLIRNEIMNTESVQNAKIESVTYDEKARQAIFVFEYTVDETTYREEIALNV